MWVSQISFDCSNALLGKIASNNKVSLVGYPLSSFQEKKEIIVNIAGTIFGKEIDKKTLGSFRKESLIKAIEVFEKLHNTKIKYIKNRKIKNISIIKQNPDLTGKQKEAMGLAIKHGYYEYPRKIDVQDLARESKLSFSTFHAHLRKAEQKLMPFFFNNEP